MSFSVLFSKLHFSVSGAGCFFSSKSLNRTLSDTLVQQTFLRTYVSRRSPVSAPCERKGLSATYRSFVRKGNNPQCDVSESTVHSNTQAGPSDPGPGLFGPSTLQSTKSQL